ncbi:MAG: cytochrome c oxidase subunit 3 [Gammaproteobacteria bacterium]
MTITLVLLAVVMAIVVWWLLRQSLNTRPWAEQGLIGHYHDGGAIPAPAVKVGLWVFLAVATSLFALFLSAYAIRMDLGDWTPLPDPPLLWLNTGVLVLGSIFFQRAKNSARREQLEGVRVGLILAGLFTFLFLIGQLWAWQQLNDEGYFLTSNPANAFFYVLTAVHGLHLLGGLWVWARATLRVYNGFEAEHVRLSVELCTLYWHFLLLVWLVLFGLLIST